MSAFGGKADINERQSHVRFGSIPLKKTGASSLRLAGEFDRCRPDLA